MNKKECIALFSLDKNYSYSDIIKSYRNLCKIHHPDVGGCSDKFSEITVAKNILINSLSETESKVSSNDLDCNLCNGSKIIVRFCSDCGGQGSFVKIAKKNGIPNRVSLKCNNCHSTGKEFCGCLLCNKDADLSREDIENYILGFKY